MIDAMSVILRVPTQVLWQGSVVRFRARAGNGAFGVLPNHVDFVTALVPGVLEVTEQDGAEQVFGIDEGLIVKRGPKVDICVRRAVRGTDLDSLITTVQTTFIEVDEEERTARAALARLEADIVRRFAELKENRP